MNLRMLRKNLEGRREGGREKRRKEGSKTVTTDSVAYGSCGLSLQTICFLVPQSQGGGHSHS